MAANDWLCQFLADVLEVPVERPSHVETTALGAAFHAGLAVGIWPDLQSLSRTWTRAVRFEPKMSGRLRSALLAGWKDAVERTLSRG
jgi:glycerol kinase